MIVIQFSLHDDLVFEKASVQHSYDKVESILSKRDDVLSRMCGVTTIISSDQDLCGDGWKKHGILVSSQ
jgi:hypothetical protein